jgi:hypothetical protein
VPAERDREISGHGNRRTKEPELIFISYSSHDLKYLKMLMPHLKVFENQKLIRIFTHDALRPGTLWLDATKSAIAAAILLVTPSYLASENLIADQLPQLLARAEQGGTVILPLLVKPSLFERVPELYRFKPFNSTPKTLI